MALESLGPMAKGSFGERVAIVIICFGYLTFASVAAVVTGQRRADYTNAASLGVLVLEIVLGTAAAFILSYRGWRRDDFAIHVSSITTIAALPLTLATLFTCGGAYAVLTATGVTRGWPDVSVRFTAAPALVLLFLVVNSFYEEFFVVGYLVEASRSSGVAYAVSVSTLVRLLYHTYQGPAALATIVPIGLIFAAVYVRYRNLWPLVVAHTLINLIAWARG